MPNACFRCKASIESGETFCGECRRVASLEFPFTRESKRWIAVLALPVLGLLAFLASYAYVELAGVTPYVGLAGAMVGWALALPWLWVLYADCRHVRKRDDVDWEPSPYLYLFAGALSVLLLVPPVLLAAYYTYRRRATVGLPR